MCQNPASTLNMCTVNVFVALDVSKMAIWSFPGVKLTTSTGEEADVLWKKCLASEEQKYNKQILPNYH